MIVSASASMAGMVQGMDGGVRPKLRRFLSVAGLLLLASVCYLNVVDAPFQFDDMAQVVKDPLTDTTKALTMANDNRYLVRLTFSLQRRMGIDGPLGFRVVNILIHACNGILLWVFIRTLWRSPKLAAAGNAGRREWLAFFSAALFIVHPVQTQAVTYIAQRFSSLAAFWSLIALISYARFRIAGDARRMAGGMWYCLTLLAVAAAMRSKETAFTLPFAILLAEMVFFSGPPKRALPLIPILVLTLIIPLTLLGLNRPLGDLIGDISQVSRETVLLSRGEYAMTEVRVLVTYLRLLVFPVNLTLDYDYPAVSSLLSLPVLLSFLVNVLMLAGAAMALRYGKSMRGLLMAGFGILFFYLALFVESSVIPIRDVIFEHRLYLPAAGIFLAMPVFADRILLPAAGRPYYRIAFVLAFAMLLLLGAGTVVRNQVWHRPDTLWMDAAAKAPNEARPYNNLGFTYIGKGDPSRAVGLFLRAIQVDPLHASSYNNLGHAYMQLGEPAAAERYLKLAIQLSDTYADPLINLGVVYNGLGRYGEALLLFRRALQLQPNSAGIYNNMGISCMMMQDSLQGIRYFEEAVRIDPSYAAARNNLDAALHGIGRN